jgi:hypothetical protein
MPDGKRKRRHSGDTTKRRWYASYRSLRFAQRFGATTGVTRRTLFPAQIQAAWASLRSGLKSESAAV